MEYPITTGNVALIILGIILVLSGPYIIYRTVKGILDARKLDPNAPVHFFSNGINLLIAVVFFVAGILFIRNNLAGNPLSLPQDSTPSQTVDA